MPIDYSKLLSLTHEKLCAHFSPKGFSLNRNVAATADISIAMGEG
jgi:hypothetical protein